MAWPPDIFNAFAPAQEEEDAKESDYYAPYNTLLGALFPPADHFMVVIAYEDPSYPTPFAVRRHGHPVFFIVIQPPGHLKNPAKLADADRQMRREIERLSTELTIPTLYGVSAIGTKICVYTYDSESGMITPDAIQQDAGRGDDKALADRWDVDVMEPEGEQRILEVVNRVKEMSDRS